MIIFLVEDYSMRKFLEGILPRLGFAAHHFLKTLFQLKQAV